MSWAAETGTLSPPGPRSAAGPRAGQKPKLGSGVRVGLLDTRMFPDAWLTGRYVARSGDLLDPDQGSFTMFDGHCAFVGSCILQQARRGNPCAPRS